MWCQGTRAIGMDFSLLDTFAAQAEGVAKRAADGHVPFGVVGYGDAVGGYKRKNLLTTIAHEWGHHVDFHLQGRIKFGDKSAQAILDLWEEGVKQVDIATWGATRSNKVVTKVSGGTTTRFVEASADRRNTWSMVSEYAATSPRVEGLAECFALASKGRWQHIPEQLHAPLRLMLEPRDPGVMAARTAAKKAAAE